MRETSVEFSLEREAKVVRGDDAVDTEVEEEARGGSSVMI